MESALKTMFEPKCGEPSPISLLVANYGRTDAVEIPSGVGHGTHQAFSHLEADQLTNEYLSAVANNTQAPSTFKVADLIAQLKLQQQHSTFDSAWITATYNGPTPQQPRDQQNQWSAEYLANNQNANLVGESWAQEFVSQLHNGEAINSGIFNNQHNNSSQYAIEFLDQFEKLKLNDNDKTFTNSDEQWIDQFMEKLKEYAAKSTAVHGEHAFVDVEHEFMESMRPQNYHFNPMNPYVGGENLLEKANFLVSQGQIADAILCYEAILGQNPENAEIWCALGLCHTENEQDQTAIYALQKSVQLNPNNAKALLTLSASLINEAQGKAALRTLDMWLSAYMGEKVVPQNLNHQQTFSEIEQKFLNAAQRRQASNNGSLDSEFFNAMSVLYNLSEDYGKAVECIRKALVISPEDPVLWNRLGATLANSDRSDEAIVTYQRALDLFPTYCRARYNLGVACMNIRSYREAAINFLWSLKIQEGNASKKNISGIWTKVRSSVIRMDNPAPNDEVMETLNGRNVDKLLNIFQ